MNGNSQFVTVAIALTAITIIINAIYWLGESIIREDLNARMGATMLMCWYFLIITFYLIGTF